jgi:hypothetical protein
MPIWERKIRLSSAQPAYYERDRLMLGLKADFPSILYVPLRGLLNWCGKVGLPQ